jgi:N-methylhydantoinase A
MGYRVTVDTGGTFSDFVYLNEATNEVSIAKLPSTPDDSSRAILAGVQHLIDKGIDPKDISYFCHGTTVGTNALLEGKGVKTGLLVTKGFRAIYEVGEQSRPYGAAIFDILYDKPKMLVPQSLTREAEERVSSSGEVLLALDEAALRESLRELKGEGIVSLAVCFLFSFLAPAHEARVREIVAEEMPDVSVSLSSDIAPQIREYYRLSTTVINAYLQPILARYIDRLEARLSGAGLKTRQKYIMQSNGGMATFDASAKKAVATVLSGPAGGVTAGLEAARATGIGNLITFDMGGTSCDVALIKDGVASISMRGKIEGRDIALPMIDINTVSAGGGTLARVDAIGQLLVGPESAGAVPGPACYGRGGTAPTITDCNLVLGYLGENNFLGGGMRLDTHASLAALTHVANALALKPEEAAEGIVRIIDVKMQEAIKAISTMRGHDLRDFHLLAFGGAGPLHAARMAENLGMAGVVVPLFPGVYSALGLLISDVKHDYVRSKMSPLAETPDVEIQRIFEELERQAFDDLHAEDFPDDRITIERALDMRYAGQGYEITVPCAYPLGAEGMRALRQRFDALHGEMFGHTAPHEPVEIVSWRLRGVGRVPPVTLSAYEPQGLSLAAARRETRPARFDGKTLDCPVYQREGLDVGVEFNGPAIIDQLDCTTVVPPGHVVRVDRFRNLLIAPEKRT